MSTFLKILAGAGIAGLVTLFGVAAWRVAKEEAAREAKIEKQERELLTALAKNLDEDQRKELLTMWQRYRRELGRLKSDIELAELNSWCGMEGA